MRGKQNYAMMKLNVPQRVTAPNGRTFVARYKRIPRNQLPQNILMTDINDINGPLAPFGKT